MSNPRQRGFTLIEMLTVIAIVAVLAALLFPVFTNARRSAKKATAISNVRQLATAQLMYAMDSDDRPTVYCGYCPFPVGNSPPFPFLEIGPNIWMKLLLPYIGHTTESTREGGWFFPEDLPRIFFDPNEPFFRLADWRPICGSTTVTSWGISDAIVIHMGVDGSPGSDPLGRSEVRTISSFGNPSRTVLFAQTYPRESFTSVCRDLVPGHALAVPAWNGFLGWSAASTVDGIYPGGQNLVAMLDGSARLLPRTKLTTSMEYWDDAWQP